MSVQKRKRTLSRGQLISLRILPAVVGAIGLATLWPSLNGGGTPGGLWCFGCGSVGTLDLINNVLLFAPLGAALAAMRWPLLTSIGAGATLSFTIEALQFLVVPGRDASPSDVVMNSVGTAAGWVLFATWKWWLHPDASAARVWFCAAAIAWLAALSGTGWLLVPSVPPDDLFGQWAPRRPPFTQYRGKILSFQLEGHEVPHSPVPDPGAVRAAFADRRAIAAIETIPALPPDKPGAMIARLLATDHEVILLAQRGDRLLGRFRLRSGDFRMRALSLEVPGTFSPNERVRIEGGFAGPSLVVRAVRPDGVRERALPLRVSLGWALIRPAEIALGGWHGWVSGLWLAGLAIPLGFYAAAATGVSGRSRWPAPLALAIAGAAIAAGLLGAPWLTSAAPSSWFDWAGAALGVLAGWYASHAIGGDRSRAATALGATAGPGRA